MLFSNFVFPTMTPGASRTPLRTTGNLDLDHILDNQHKRPPMTYEQFWERHRTLLRQHALMTYDNPDLFIKFCLASMTRKEIQAAKDSHEARKPKSPCATPLGHVKGAAGIH